MKQKLLYVVLGCLLSANVSAKTVIYSGNLVDEPGLGGSQNYDLDLSARGIDELSAVITASSATIASVTFNDGRASTGSFLISTLTDLTTAFATAQLTVLTVSSLEGSIIRVGSIPFIEGKDWYVKATPALTATEIAAQMNIKFAGIFTSTAPAGSAVVYSTYNVAGLAANETAYSSSVTSMTVSAATFTGGKDGGWVAIGGTKFVAGTDFLLGATPTTAAAALATAITASSVTTHVVASSVAGTVTTTSTVVGAVGNLGLTASSPTAITPNHQAMTGGVDSAYSLAGSNIYIPTHGMSTGFGIYLSTPTGYGIAPLVNNTTYYIIKVDADNVKLALTRALAVAGTPIVFTSTYTPTTTNTFTLNVPAITGTPSWKWQVSNDGTYFADLTANQGGVTVSSQTLLTYTYGGATQAWDLGNIGYRYLRLAVVGPTAGPIWIKAAILGKKD